MDMLTKTRVFTALDIKVRVLIVAMGLIPVGILTYIGIVSSSISSPAAKSYSIDIGTTQTSFFYESSQAGASTLINSSAQLVTDPVLVHSGSQALRFTASDYQHFSQNYFNYVGVTINAGDVLEFYIRSASNTFNAAGVPKALGVVLTYSSGDASSTSQLIDITPQFMNNIVTTEYQKIEIPREDIQGGFSGKMRTFTLRVNPALVGSGQSFIIDDIVIRRRVVDVGSGVTQAKVLGGGASMITAGSARISWPEIAGATGIVLKLAPLNFPANRQAIATVNATQTSYIINDLAANSSFIARIEAQGVVKSYEINFKTLATVAPVTKNIFFDETALSGSGAQTVVDAAKAYQGVKSLRFDITRPSSPSSLINGPSMSFFAPGSDVLSFYIKTASGYYDKSLYLNLDFSGAGNKSQDINLKDYLVGGVVTDSYQKISIPKADIKGKFNGTFRHFTLKTDSVDVKNKPSFFVDAIILEDTKLPLGLVGPVSISTNKKITIALDQKVDAARSAVKNIYKITPSTGGKAIAVKTVAFRSAETSTSTSVSTGTSTMPAIRQYIDLTLAEALKATTTYSLSAGLFVAEKQAAQNVSTAFSLAK